MNSDSARMEIDLLEPCETPSSRTSRRVGAPARRSGKASGWTSDEDEVLREAVEQHQGKNWKAIATHLQRRSDVQCLHRWTKVLHPDLVKGAWSSQEDEELVRLVEHHGARLWSTIARSLPGRIGKQCRERWHNHLKPDIKRSEWTQAEDQILVDKQHLLGNAWAKLCKFLPGRTDNGIKNRWNSTVRKRVDAQELYPSSATQQAAATIPDAAAGPEQFVRVVPLVHRRASRAAPLLKDADGAGLSQGQGRGAGGTSGDFGPPAVLGRVLQEQAFVLASLPASGRNAQPPVPDGPFLRRAPAQRGGRTMLEDGSSDDPSSPEYLPSQRQVVRRGARASQRKAFRRPAASSQAQTSSADACGAAAQEGLRSPPLFKEPAPKRRRTGHGAQSAQGSLDAGSPPAVLFAAAAPAAGAALAGLASPPQRGLHSAPSSADSSQVEGGGPDVEAAAVAAAGTAGGSQAALELGAQLQYAPAAAQAGCLSSPPPAAHFFAGQQPQPQQLCAYSSEAQAWHDLLSVGACAPSPNAQGVPFGLASPLFGSPPFGPAGRQQADHELMEAAQMLSGSRPRDDHILPHSTAAHTEGGPASLACAARHCSPPEAAKLESGSEHSSQFAIAFPARQLRASCTPGSQMRCPPALIVPQLELHGGRCAAVGAASMQHAAHQLIMSPQAGETGVAALLRGTKFGAELLFGPAGTAPAGGGLSIEHGNPSSTAAMHRCGQLVKGEDPWQ